MANLEAVWDVLTPHNRGRLLRAIVERVDVDDSGGNVRILFADVRGEEPLENLA